MNANELADAMEIRASIRKKATNRKSVQENANDRLADQLTQAATMLRQQQAEIEALKLRELSDEEIIEIASPMFVDVRYPSTALEFARAILKKAREK